MTTEQNRSAQMVRLNAENVDPGAAPLGQLLKAGRRKRRHRTALLVTAGFGTLTLATTVAAWTMSSFDTTTRPSASDASSATNASPDAPTVTIVTGDLGGAIYSARIFGEVDVDSEGCFTLRRDRQPALKLVWPPGFTTELDDGRQVVLDESGRVFVAVGGAIETGGAYGTSKTYPPCVQPTDDYALVQIAPAIPDDY